MVRLVLTSLLTSLGFAPLVFASPFVIITEHGYELSKSRISSEYNRLQIEGARKEFEIFQSKEKPGRYLRTRTLGTTDFVVIGEESKSDQNLTQKISRAAFVDGKLKSQLNCSGTSLSSADCYAITGSLCNYMLKATGKSDLKEMAKDVQSCKNLLEVYPNALKNPQVAASIRAAYQLHTEGEKPSSTVGKKLDQAGDTLARWLGFTPNYSQNAPTLKLESYVGVINTCAEYQSRSLISEATANGSRNSNTSSGGVTR